MTFTNDRQLSKLQVLLGMENPQRVNPVRQIPLTLAAI